jgi:hypothetical protein
MNQATQAAKSIAVVPATAANRQTVLQRKCACGQHTSSGECEECKKKKESGGSGDALLRRSALSRSTVGRIPSSVHDAFQYQGQPLDKYTQSRLESSFHCDLSRVRVHSDAAAARAASDINARAFTFGQSIWFGQNEFDPQSHGGFHLLAHEIAHTVQQGTQTPAVQRSLAIGSVDDPSEAAADRAADAVLHSDSVPGLGDSQPIIRRQPKFPLVEDLGTDKKRVSLDEHTHYVVTRVATATKRRSDIPAPPTVGVGADFAKAWVRVEWCQDRVEGRVDLGIDVTKELQTLIPKLLEAVATKGDVESVFKGATVTPYLDVLVAQSGKWQLNAKVEVDVGKDGATSERGSLKLHTSWVDLSASLTVDQTPQGSKPGGVIILTIPLEKAPRKFTCKDKRKEWWEQSYTYQCTKEKDPAPPKTEPPAPLAARDREIFFCWAKAVLNEGQCKPGPQDKGKESADNSAKAAAANKQALDDLNKDFGAGYKISGVTGYTSPEGPPGPLGEFEGNKILADERGTEALKIIASRSCFPRRPEICIPGGVAGITPANGGSLPGSAPDYPLLRKATVHLVPPAPASEPGKPEKPSLDLPKDYFDCPPQVIDLAFPKQSSKGD